MESETNPASAGNSGEARQKKILIVEDEPLLGNLLRRRLEKEDFDITLVRDGEEALRVLEEGPAPNLVLLDIILPKISGFELMERMNQNAKLLDQHIPIVIISNLGQEGDVQKGQALGAIGYFVKAQLSIEDLVSKVREFFA
ncbi:MAG: response regulator [Nanoarchaeota archaeon]|nr:response regulator [Nanoarchaeota archaeon]